MKYGGLEISEVKSPNALADENSQLKRMEREAHRIHNCFLIFVVAADKLFL